MCYILYMNKDVIYIEADDDITDIISKIENAKERIVALVPSKSGVLKSIVNIKLMAKSAIAAGKTIVLVTVDPAIIKFAAMVKIPVTKDLKTAPKIPNLDELADATPVAKEVVVEKMDQISAEEVEPEPKEDEGSEESIEEKNSPKEEVPSSSKKEKKEKKEKKPSNNPIIKWIVANKLWVIIGSSALVVIALVLVWALVLAPAVTITVSVKTTSNNFSEAIKFTTNLEEEDSQEGLFYLEEHKIESESKAEFNATGTKNVGDKATGSLVLYAYFKDKGSINIPAATNFTFNNMAYAVNDAATLSWDGKFNACENDYTELGDSCLKSVTLKATATESGEKYNVGASKEGWTSSIASIKAYAKTDFTGGTDKTITVVSQSDIDKAKEGLRNDSESENKAALIEELSEDQLAIESSFKQVVSDPVSSIALDSEVKNNEPVTLTSTTTATIFVIDLTKVKEYISEKAKVSEKNRIYALGSPFVENFFEAETGWTGKLKTAYTVGPNMTEASILEDVKGVLVGEVKSILKNNGAHDVKVDRSFPWVNSVPSDPNKITINLEMEE